MLSIMVLFHLWPDKTCKQFRRYGMEQELGRCFAQLPLQQVCGLNAAAAAAL